MSTVRVVKDLLLHLIWLLLKKVGGHVFFPSDMERCWITSFVLRSTTLKLRGSAEFLKFSNKKGRWFEGINVCFIYSGRFARRMVESGAERTTTTKSLLESSYNGVIFYGAICSEFIIHHNLCREQQGELLLRWGYHQASSLYTFKPLDFKEYDATAAFSVIYILKICIVIITFIFRHREWLYSCK